MTTESEMTVEATLSGSAAKLLLHLLRLGAGQRTTAELMRGAGIGNRETYYAAKAQLVECGLWENPTVLFGNPTPLSAFPTPPVGIPDTPVGKVDTPVRLTDSTVWFPDTAATATWPPIYIGTTDPTAAWPPREVPAEERNFSEVLEKTARELCLEADALPEDGDPRSPSSNYRRRRDAQVKALCMAYNDMFPQKTPLQVTMAKQLLQLTHDCAEDIYDAFEDTYNNPRDIEYPASWVRKMLEARPKDEAKPKAKAVEDHTGEMLDWTPEMEAQAQAGREKLKRLGLSTYLMGETE